MRLQGIHHITAMTADAQANLDFYVGLLGLRFVKKTVNFDAPDVYHLYYGDETGSPGSIMTFFEFPQAARGRHGAGMIHTIQWRVASEAALDFWRDRVLDAGLDYDRSEGSLRFADPEGLGIELVVAGGPELRAFAGDIPSEFAITGFHGARAYAADPARSTALLETMGFTGEGAGWELAGARWTYEPAPEKRGLQGAGTVHHIAWTMEDADEARWGAVVAQAGARPTQVIDRTYFHSVYFREPSGVLFELATPSPGFAVDEPAESLGEALLLPPQHEHLRPQLERALTPIANPRPRAVTA
jgi:glyoxalase family protein